MIENMVHKFCVKVFTSHTPPDQWITNVNALLPKKGDLTDQPHNQL